MYGLPVTTTVIMLGVLGFWVLYTVIFYLISASWSVEDADDRGEVTS